MPVIFFAGALTCHWRQSMLGLRSDVTDETTPMYVARCNVQHGITSHIRDWLSYRLIRLGGMRVESDLKRYWWRKSEETFIPMQRSLRVKFSLPARNFKNPKKKSGGLVDIYALASVTCDCTCLRGYFYMSSWKICSLWDFPGNTFDVIITCICLLLMFRSLLVDFWHPVNPANLDFHWKKKNNLHHCDCINQKSFKCFVTILTAG